MDADTGTCECCRRKNTAGSDGLCDECRHAVYEEMRADRLAAADFDPEDG